MNSQKPEYLVPALIAGAAAGVLSGIPVVNCLCCLWIIGGGVLAAHLLAKKTPGPLSGGDGAIVGALTGIAAAVAKAVLEIPMRHLNEAIRQRLLEGMPQFSDQLPSWMPSWLQDAVQRGTEGNVSVASLLFGLFFSAAVFAVLGVLGGVIGVSIFGRKKTASPPPQPPQPMQGPPDAAA